MGKPIHSASTERDLIAVPATSKPVASVRFYFGSLSGK